MTRLRTKAMADSYLEVRDTIQSVCRWFAQAYGGDRDELESEAMQHFVHAYQTYNPHTAKWRTWVRESVFRGLQTTARKLAVRNKVLARQDIELDLIHKPARFDLDQFTADLSPLAAELVRLTVDPPPALRREVMRNRHPDDPGSIARTVFAWVSEIGWTLKEIAKASLEIGEALRG